MCQSAKGFDALTYETVRIMYDRCHWFALAVTEGQVFIADSLRDVISPEVAMQIRQLYPRAVGDDGRLTVNIVPCTQQLNTNYCGVYAAVNCFEWVCSSLSANLRIKFEVKAE